MSSDDINRLTNAFFQLNDTVLGSLDISGFEKVTDSVYDSIRRTAREARSLGIDVEDV